MVIPSTMGTHQSDPLGGALFALTHFRALCFTTSHFPFYLFPSIINDNHIIAMLSIVSFTYEHFQIELCVIGLFIQPKKCVAWFPLAYCLTSTPHLNLAHH
jgi:putative effector of murein hydrolase